MASHLKILSKTKKAKSLKVFQMVSTDYINQEDVPELILLKLLDQQELQ